jgi:hypothetical protein
MKKRMFGLLLVALCVAPTMASAQPIRNLIGGGGSSQNRTTRLPAAAAQAVGQIGTAAVSVLPEILAGRRTYTPPIDMTTVLSAQY